jgi:hypothetical protein
MRGPVGTWSLPFESVAQDVCGEAQSLTLQPSALDRICTNLLLCKCNFVLKACSFAHGTPNMHTSSFPIRPSLHPSIHPSCKVSPALCLWMLDCVTVVSRLSSCPIVLLLCTTAVLFSSGKLSEAQGLRIQHTLC